MHNSSVSVNWKGLAGTCLQAYPCTDRRPPPLRLRSMARLFIKRRTLRMSALVQCTLLTSPPPRLSYVSKSGTTSCSQGAQMRVRGQRLFPYTDRQYPEASSRKALERSASPAVPSRWSPSSTRTFFAPPKTRAPRSRARPCSCCER